MAKNKEYHRRSWLNKSKDSNAFIRLSHYPDNLFPIALEELDLTIQDCSRNITLDFSYSPYKKADIKARIAKAELLLDYVHDIMGLLTTALDNSDEAKKQHDAYVAKRKAKKKSEDYI